MLQEAISNTLGKKCKTGMSQENNRKSQQRNRRNKLLNGNSRT